MRFPALRFVSLTVASLLVSACGASSNASLSAANGSDTEALSTSGSAAAHAIRLEKPGTLCLDVKDDTNSVGATLQVWACHYGDNQTFSLDGNGLIHVFADKCLAVSAGGDGAVTLATCATSEAAQQWQVQNDTLVAAASGHCLSVSSSAATDGTTVLSAACQAGSTEQAWAIGNKVSASGAAASSSSDTTPSSGSSTSTGSSTTLASGAAKTLSDEPAATMDALSAKVPTRLKAQMGNIATAAAQYNLQPQLLVAIAMEESTGGSDASAYSNGGGMFQFTDTGTWKEFGTSNPSDRQNDALSVTAAAKYLAYLLNESNNSFSAALRSYNGAVADGGNPNYITDIEKKMLGNF